MTRVFSRRRANFSRETVFGVVSNRKGLIVVLHPNDGSDRTEDFLTVDSHLIRGVDVQGRGYVIPGRVAFKYFALKFCVGAIHPCDFEISQVFVELPLIDRRTDVRSAAARQRPAI